MIPFFQYITVQIGPLTLYVWGFFVALGIVVAMIVGGREARMRGLSRDIFFDFGTWGVVGGLVGGRLLYVLAYAPSVSAFFKNPLTILEIWKGGMSSMGGFIGAALAIGIFCAVRKVNFIEYAQVAAYALPCGYGIGRIGCFLIHDHPGTLSNSLLAVKYPGGARLDHGLLLSIFGFLLFAAFWLLRWRRGGAKGGQEFPLFLIAYGAVRFILDFYRAWDLPIIDARYFGLTPAQYVGVAAVVMGVYLLYKRQK